MRYYLIAGEASGDLHASRLMAELQRQDAAAEFRFYGGDQMAAVGGTMVRHYRELAYMGFVPVLLHLPTILKNMRRAKHDIEAWQPDVLILVDYPGFNLKIAKYVHKKGICPVYYYIAPKIWAWKEYRIKNIKRDVDELFSILPFEKDFFEKKHHYPIHYVGNPTKEEVDNTSPTSLTPDPSRGGEGRIYSQGENGAEDVNRTVIPLEEGKPVIALLCGSRRQEIKANLPTMLQITDKLADSYQAVIAGAPGIDADYYDQFTSGHRVSMVHGQTYSLLSQAHAALVTSGTATLETALFNVPQVVCYETRPHFLFGWLRKMFLKVKYVSLVNLVADREVVPELVADTFIAADIEKHLNSILPVDSPQRQDMLQGYREVRKRLGEQRAPENAARLTIDLLRKRSH